LIVRKMLGQLDASWSMTAHKDVPLLLTGKIIKRIRKVLRNQERQQLITDAESIRHSVNVAASELADIMTCAREVRVVADYEPDKKVLRTGNVVKLVDHSIEEARKWPLRASACSGTILKMWRQLGLS
jgi:hypothetical protein